MKAKGSENSDPDHAGGSDEQSDELSVVEPASKKRRVTQSESTPPGPSLEPKVTWDTHPAIDYKPHHNASSSLIFSELSRNLEPFVTTKEEESSEDTSVKDIEIPTRNPRRRLHEVASKLRSGLSTTPTWSDYKIKRFSSSHFSFDATDADSLLASSPPVYKPMLMREPSMKIPSSKVMQLASDINLDENAVGSLLVILNEDSGKQ